MLGAAVDSVHATKFLLLWNLPSSGDEAIARWVSNKLYDCDENDEDKQSKVGG